MIDILIALALGIIAGLIDIIPMIRQKVPKVPKFSILFVFAQWVFIGMIIPFVNWEIQPWLKGLIIGELGMVPVMILTFYRNKKAVIPTAVFGAILGIGIAVAAAKFIG